MSRGPRVVKIPVSGDAEYNTGIITAIGSLVVSSTCAESVFLTIYRHLLRHDNLSAEIVWLSFRGNVKGRLDLLQKLAKEQISDPSLRKSITKACDNFIGFSRVRNYYCHAVYIYNENGRIVEVHSAETTYDDDPIKITNKPMNLSTLNEINDTSRKLVRFSATLWDLSDRIAHTLGVPPESRIGQPVPQN